MATVRTKTKKITLGGKTYDIVFTLGAIDLIQEELGESMGEVFQDLSTPGKDVKALLALFNGLLNRNEEVITDKEIRNITIADARKSIPVMLEAWQEGTPDTANPQSAPTKTTD